MRPVFAILSQLKSEDRSVLTSYLEVIVLERENMSEKRNNEGDRGAKKRIFKGNQYTASKDESTTTSQTVNISFSTPAHVITLPLPPSSQLSAQTVYDNLATPKEEVKQSVSHSNPTDKAKKTDPVTGYRVILSFWR